MEKPSSKSGEEMSEQIVVLYLPKPKPYGNFLEAALRALFKCLGVEAPDPSCTTQQAADSPTTPETEQVDDDPPATPANPEADPPAPTAPESTEILVSASKPPISTGRGGEIN